MTVTTAVVHWRDEGEPPLKTDLSFITTINGVTQISTTDGQNFYIPLDQYRFIIVKRLEVPSK